MEKNTKMYCHKVLEAKLVLSKKIVLSIDTEFIENEKENVQKHDCETNATKRLLGRLKQDYPRLPICIQADNLYETQPMMELCHKNGFRYILTHKESRQKNIGQSYRLFLESGDAESVMNIGAEKGRAVYVNHVEKQWSQKIQQIFLNTVTQIADIIMQLYLAWNPMRKAIKLSIKNTSSMLLESFRGLKVTDEDVSKCLRYTTVYLE